MRVFRFVPTGVLAAFVAPLAAPAPAAAAFTCAAGKAGVQTAPAFLPPSVQMDNAGRTIIAWVGQPQEHTQALVGRAGDLENRSVVSPEGGTVGDAQVAVDPRSKRAAVVWTRDDGTYRRLELRFREANGTLGPVVTLSRITGTQTEPRVAIDEAGVATVVWRQADVGSSRGRVFLRQVRAGLTLGPLVALSPSATTASAPQVAVNPAGVGAATWEAAAEGRGPRVWVATVHPDGTISRSQTISPASFDTAKSPRIGVDASGRAVIAWRATLGEERLVQTGWNYPTSGPSVRFTMARSTIALSRPVLSVNPDGTALLAWQRSLDGTVTRIEVRTQRPGSGGASRPQLLSSAREDAVAPTVAIDPAGRSIIGWQTPDEAGGSRVVARRRAADGTLGTREILRPCQREADQPETSRDLTVAIDDEGNAAAVFVTTDAGAIVVAHEPAPGG